MKGEDEKSTTEQRLAKLVDKQGLLLERQAAKVLSDVGFHIEHSSRWLDYEGEQAWRETDVLGELRVQNARKSAKASLLAVVSCKRSRTEWVFADDPGASNATGSVFASGLRATDLLLEHPFIKWSGSSKQCFVSNHVVSKNEAKEEEQGDRIIRQAVAEAVKAAWYHHSTRQSSRGAAMLVVPFVVTTADLYLARFDLEGQGKIVIEPTSTARYLDRRPLYNSGGDSAGDRTTRVEIIRLEELRVRATALKLFAQSIVEQE
jgi:hypothetical protein